MYNSQGPYRETKGDKQGPYVKQREINKNRREEKKRDRAKSAKKKPRNYLITHMMRKQYVM
jgi:hypothetical protein